MESFMDDLALVTQNVFSFSEASCEDMRERVTHRVTQLNEKSEADVLALQNHLEKYVKG